MSLGAKRYKKAIGGRAGCSTLRKQTKVHRRVIKKIPMLFNRGEDVSSILPGGFIPFP